MAQKVRLKRCPRCELEKPASSEHFYVHNGKRAAKDGFQAYCKPCVKAKAVEWQKANPEKKAASDKKQDLKPERQLKKAVRCSAYFEANRERELARLKAWNLANADRAKVRIARWQESNPDRVRTAHEKHHAKPERKQYLRDAARFRRTLRLGSGGILITEDVWDGIKEMFGNVCCYCDTPDNLTVDHIDPISRGGLHIVQNLAPACERCNKSKRAKTLEEFAPERAEMIRAKAIECGVVYAEGSLREEPIARAA